MGSTTDVYAILRKELEGTDAEVLLPDSPGYKEAIVRWSDSCIKEAQAVVFVRGSSSISKCLSFAKTHSVPFVVKGGGHSTSGSSSISDGFVIDLSKLRGVTVDPEKKTIRAEGGTIWEDVDVEAAKYGLATPGGTVNHTGVGGLTLGGGYGYLSGKYGLTIDNLLSVEIVLANGELVTASQTEHADLFWAVRGAGQNFGVVTAFTFRGHPQPNPVFAGTLVFPPDKLAKIVEFANYFHTATDGNQALLWGFTSPPPVGAPVVILNVFHNGTAEEGQAFFKDLFELGPLVNMATSIPYTQLNALLNPAAGYGGRKQFGGGAFKLPLNPQYVESLHKDFTEFVDAHEGMSESMLLFETIPYKKVIEVPNETMAFSNRGDYYNVATMFKWSDPSLDATIRDFSRSFLRKASQSAGVEQDEAVRAKQGVGVYGNYSNNDANATEVYGDNAKRLEDLKHKYDPDNLFSRGLRLVPRPLVVVN